MKIEKVLIESLILDPSNVRLHDDKNLEAIKGSLAAFGQQKNIVVDKNNIVIAGNGTLQAARALGWKEVTINRTDLEGVNAVAFALADNRSAELATWDDEALGKTLHGLREMDFDLTSIGFDTSDLDSIFEDKTAGKENPYSTSITAPVYTPTGEKPPIEALVDSEKAKKLIADIEASNLSAQLKEFLQLAAYRHLVFDYRNIAEFYAHESAESQEFFERSALVIIDFNRALEDGFIKMTEELFDIHSSEGLDERP